MISSRRGFLGGLMALVAAPAIVRITSIMPVKALELPANPTPAVVEEVIGIFENPVIGGERLKGAFKVIGIPSDPLELEARGDTWRSFKGSWSRVETHGLEGTPFRIVPVSESDDEALKSASRF